MSLDMKLQIFADLYARYKRRNEDWIEDTGETEGPWQEAMEGLQGYAESRHGITGDLIRRTAEEVEL